MTKARRRYCVKLNANLIKLKLSIKNYERYIKLKESSEICRCLEERKVFFLGIGRQH